MQHPEALTHPNFKDVVIVVVVVECSPLSFIFEHTAYNGMDALMKKIITQQGEELMNNNLPWSCLNISPDSCCKGNLVMCEYTQLAM